MYKRQTRDLPGDTLGVDDEVDPVATATAAAAAASSDDPSAAAESAEAASSDDPCGSSEDRRTRGPDQGPRAERKAHAETASGPEHNPSWQGFDVHRSIAGLLTGTNAACQRILRRLHLRWWHAPAAAMARTLTQAGAPKRAIDLIPDICLLYTSPSPRD